MKHEILNPFVMAACVLAGIGHFGGAARPVEPPPPPPPEKEEKGVQSFKGRVTAVDTSGRMLTVDGKRMYVPDSTRLTKKGRPITLYDVAVNDLVSATARQAFDGKLESIAVTVEPHP